MSSVVRVLARISVGKRIERVNCPLWGLAGGGATWRSEREQLAGVRVADLFTVALQIVN